MTLLLLSGVAARGDSLPNPIGISFESASASVFDLTGDYLLSQEVQGSSGSPVPLFFGVTITNDVNGRLRSTGVTAVLLGNDYVAANYRLSGSIATAGTNRQVTLDVSLNGQDIIAGNLRKFNMSLHYNLKVNSQTQALEGKARGTVNVQGSGEGRVKTDSFSAGLPAVQDGTWDVFISFLALDQIGGTGTITLSNGRTFPATVSGSYSANSSKGTVYLHGINEGKGVNTTIKFGVEEGQPVINKMTGNLLGQQVKQ
jgi:hypothetical protein